MGNPGTLRAFFLLNRRERSLVSKVAFALLASWAGFRLFGFFNWKKWTTRFSEKKIKSSPMSMESAQHLANLAAATARRLFVRTNCLEQSLVLWLLLRRRGVPATLRFGGRKHEAQFEAHAWVEWQGTVLNDDGVYLEFTPFEGLEAPPVALEKYTR